MASTEISLRDMKRRFVTSWLEVLIGLKIKQFCINVPVVIHCTSNQAMKHNNTNHTDLLSKDTLIRNHNLIGFYLNVKFHPAPQF